MWTVANLFTRTCFKGASFDQNIQGNGSDGVAVQESMLQEQVYQHGQDDGGDDRNQDHSEAADAAPQRLYVPPS